MPFVSNRAISGSFTDLGDVATLPITTEDNNRYWVGFRYERLPLYCYGCGKIGHMIQEGCQDNEGEGEGAKYGEWLKANSEARHPLTGKIKHQQSSGGKDGKETCVGMGQIVVADTGNRDVDGGDGSTSRIQQDHVNISFPAEVLHNKEASYELLGEMRKQFDLLFAGRMEMGIRLETERIEIEEMEGLNAEMAVIPVENRSLAYIGEVEEEGIEKGNGTDGRMGQADTEVLEGKDPNDTGEFVFAAKKKTARLSPKIRSPSKRPIVCLLAGAKRKLFSGENRKVVRTGRAVGYKTTEGNGSQRKKQKGCVQIEEIEPTGMESEEDVSLSAESGRKDHFRRDQ